MQRCSFPTLLLLHKLFPRGGAPPSIHPSTARTSFSSSLSAARNSPPSAAQIEKQVPPSVLPATAAYTVPPIDLVKRLPNHELGLLSLLFALSISIAAMISVALISIPTAIVMKRSKVAAEKLVRVVGEEVPGTLYSLKFSGREVDDLTRELRNLKKWISGNRNGKK